MQFPVYNITLYSGQYGMKWLIIHCCFYQQTLTQSLATSDESNMFTEVSSVSFTEHYSANLN